MPMSAMNAMFNINVSSTLNMFCLNHVLKPLSISLNPQGNKNSKAGRLGHPKGWLHGISWNSKAFRLFQEGFADRDGHLPRFTSDARDGSEMVLGPWLTRIHPELAAGEVEMSIIFHQGISHQLESQSPTISIGLKRSQKLKELCFF